MQLTVRSASVAACTLTLGVALGAGSSLGISSVKAEPAAPYVSSQSYEAALISRDYNRTSDRAERSSLYQAYIAAPGTCLSYARP